MNGDEQNIELWTGTEGVTKLFGLADLLIWLV